MEGAASNRGGLALNHGRERQPICACIDAYRLTLTELTLQQSERKRILQLALDHTLQRASAVDRIVADLGQVLAGRRADLEMVTGLLDSLCEPGQLDLNDAGQVVLRQAMEHDHLIDAVEELRAEVVCEQFSHLILGGALGG